MALASKPPTDELGTEQPLGGMPGGGLGGVAPWQSFVDFYERTPELIWPRSVQTFTGMRHDSQVEALHAGTALPIRRYKWMIDPNGARPDGVAKFSEDTGLPVKGEDAKPQRRIRDRFSWQTTLRHILLAPLYGHMYFEQVGYIGDDGLWHLKKLAPRMPDTIQDIMVAEDGGLVGIKQMTGLTDKPIPVDRLVAFIWDKEGANWAGRSMLRSIFKDFIIKDRLIRVMAQMFERNGMGMPVIEAPPNASDPQIKQLTRLAMSWRAGEQGGAAIPNGAHMTLQGVQGTLPDILGGIRARDEAMARRFLMMFMQLGQTETGSRALGGEFIDWFALAQEAVADWVVDVFTSHVIEDYWDWNFGEGEALAPRLTYDRDEDTQLPVADLVGLIDSGAVVVDEELEAALREKYDLPQRAEGDQAPPGPAPQPAPTKAQRRGKRRAARMSADAPSVDDVQLPDRELRRQPTTAEAAAKTNFAKLDTQWASALDKLVKSWGNVRDTQIGQLHAKVKAAGDDLNALSGLTVDAIGSDVIETRLKSVATQAAKDMIKEASEQGAEVDMPDMSAWEERLTNRAEAVDNLLARSLAEAGSRRAVAVSGGALTAGEVADDVQSYLKGMTDSWLRDQLGGAITAAQNAGRKAVMQEGKPAAIYASELLDANTCEECTAIDGTEYGSVDEAEADYPTGGYLACLGGPRCRGTLVSVFDEAPAA
jgi:hypothetical protein